MKNLENSDIRQKTSKLVITLNYYLKYEQSLVGLLLEASNFAYVISNQQH